jgi:hypothetical protein
VTKRPLDHQSGAARQTLFHQRRESEGRDGLNSRAGCDLQT